MPLQVFFFTPLYLCKFVNKYTFQVMYGTGEFL